jgi:hypothetical protein
MRFTDPNFASVAHVAANLRGSDRAEVLASHGQSGPAAVFTSLAASWHSRVILGDTGEPVGLCGVARGGLVWMLGTPALLGTASHRWQFLRAGRVWVDRLVKLCGQLHNWTDARNAQAVRWLRTLGFTIYPPAPFGPQGLPFHHFSRVA